MFTKLILPQPDSCAQHCHCPTITRSPRGDLLVAWYAYPEEETRNGRLVLIRKPAGQAGFEPARLVLAEMKASLGNPVLFCDGNSRVHLLFVALRGHYWDSAVAHACHSDDMGKTWSAPESLRLGPGMMVRHPPITRQNGDFLLPVYDETRNRTVLLTADSSATGWVESDQLNGMEAIQGCIVRHGDRELNMVLRPSAGNRTCLRCVSADDGRSWSQVTRTALPNPLSGVAAFQSGGMTCVVYNHTAEHRRYPLSLSYSGDRCTSWTGPIHIDETPHELSYPSFLTDENGVAHGVYTFGRRRIQYVSFDQTWWMR